VDDTPTGTLEIVSDDAWVGDVRVPIRTGQPLPDLRLEPRRLLWERADVVEGDPPGCADAPEEGPALGTLEVHHTAVPEVGSPVRVELRGHETPE